MSKLLIVESPAKSKTIEKYLGSNYKVLSSVGHIRDIPKSASKKANAVDIENGFTPNYVIIDKKQKVIDELKKAAKKAEEVLIATDPDREGEAIGWHIKEVLELGDDDYSRITFNEITKDAVLEALRHPRKIDNNLKTAQEARRVLDRLFGYGLSGLIWKKVRYGLSAGRVQSPALRILAEREREILAFIPDDYFQISAQTKTKRGHLVELSYHHDIYKESEKDLVESECASKKEFIIRDIKEGEVSRKPNAPFTTSTLQQTASNRLGFAPARTMRAAQKLYEAGYITYMRTDSPTLSKQAITQIAGFVEDSFGKDYLEIKQFASKSKNAQEAHEAIRPTEAHKTSGGRTDDEKQLYNLIWKRTIASQMKSAQTLRTKVIASNSEHIDNFSVSGSRLIFDGWLKVFPEAAGDDVLLPELSRGDTLRLIKLEVEAKQTTPPNRYSEAGLIRELESRGIGRPSTYAAIIKTLQDREYVHKEGKTLIPTDLGMVISDFLETHFAEYISDDFTAEMEDNLDLMSVGKKEYVKTLSEFYKPFTQAIEGKQDIEKLTTIGPVEDQSISCPDCGGKMEWKLSKTGKFMSCARFPDCEGARTEDGKELEGPKDLGTTCPRCLEENKKEPGSLVLRDGRFGQFISCSTYPKCKYIQEDEETKKANGTGVKCTECKDGEMMKKMGRFGEFFACSNYPDCKHAIKALPTGNHCPMCGALMMQGTKTIPERCSKKECPMHRPDKLEKT
ncbi:MAG: type I DNA topoisomerase [Patescibacteria group bacterium]